MLNPNNVQQELWELCRKMLLEARRYRREAREISPDSPEALMKWTLLRARAGATELDAKRFLVYLRAEVR